MMRLVAVSPDEVATVWPHVAAFIESACRRGPENDAADSMREGCETGRFQLWLTGDQDGVIAAAVTGYRTIHDRKTCVWLAVGGLRMRDWHALQEKIEAVAKAHGCVAMRSYSRPGMVRRMTDYRVKGVILEKAI